MSQDISFCLMFYAEDGVCRPHFLGRWDIFFKVIKRKLLKITKNADIFREIALKALTNGKICVTIPYCHYNRIVSPKFRKRMHHSAFSSAAKRIGRGNTVFFVPFAQITFGLCENCKKRCIKFFSHLIRFFSEEERNFPRQAFKFFDRNGVDKLW